MSFKNHDIPTLFFLLMIVLILFQGAKVNNEYCFTSLSVQSWQYRDRRKPEVGTMPCSYFEWLQGFFIVPSTIGGIVHSKLLNSLEHLMHNHYDKYPARQEF